MSQQRIQVGFVSPLLFEHGGTESWHRTLFAHLDRSRIDVLGMAVLDHEQFCEQTAADMGVPVDVGEKAVKALCDGSDVVVMWGIAEPDRFLGVHRPKTVFVSHGCGRSRWTCSVVKAANKSRVIDHFVAVSKAALGPIVEAGAKGAVLIHNGIDLAVFDPARDRDCEETPHWYRWIKQARRDGKKVIGYLGRLSHEKRPVGVIEALRVLGDGWVALIAGKDYMQNQLWQAGQIHAPGRVMFAGEADPALALSVMDWLVVPSDTEGFGLVIAEAWAMKVPVLSTPVGIALEHPNLVVTIPQNPLGIQIARAIEAHQRNELLRVDRVNNADKTVRKLYNAERFGGAWSEFLCHVARAAPGPGQARNAH